MAEGLLRRMAGDRFEVESAGVRPARVRPEAIAVMQEIGIDLTGHRSKSVDEFLDQPFDFVITVCDNAREHCPIFPGAATRIHWSFEDPTDVESFRTVRDQIAAKLRAFVDGTSSASHHV